MKVPKRPQKTKVINFRVTEADHATWSSAAIADRVSLADWIRRRCDGRPASAPKLLKVPQ
jgi:predicted HicB family RNase H-like nuclease